MGVLRECANWPQKSARWIKWNFSIPAGPDARTTRAEDRSKGQIVSFAMAFDSLAHVQTLTNRVYRGLVSCDLPRGWAGSERRRQGRPAFWAYCLRLSRISTGQCMPIV